MASRAQAGDGGDEASLLVVDSMQARRARKHLRIVFDEGWFTMPQRRPDSGHDTSSLPADLRGGTGASAAGVAERFADRWQALGADTDEPELLPARLARACADVLGVDGAGLSVSSGAFRVPLGASDDAASLAERLQFTQGEGPCLDAAAHGRTLVATQQTVQHLWPMYAQELLAHTPYRAVSTVPLMVASSTPGALDLFLRDPTGTTAAVMDEAATLAAAIVEALTASRLAGGGEVTRWGEQPQPAWLHGPPARDRSCVWVAVGMVMTEVDTTSVDALALLRAYAYSHDTTVDGVAGALVGDKLTVPDLDR